ncbi:MAG: MarR family transcriptional regulator [Synergistaceae bacterium]|jgi:DNA-binding MarR family transcriptional regulator|nr:MarR family transcriptional regulator [Synergistaceae bacterium]
MNNEAVREEDKTTCEVINSIIEFTTAFERAEYATGRLIGRYLEEDDAKLMRGLAMTLSEYHALHHIGARLPEDGASTVNGVRLARAMSMTKGGISKLVGKLQKKGLVRAERHQDNRKEIYYRLTEKGVRIFTLHARLHDIADANLAKIVRGYGKDEQLLILEFLKKIIDAVGIFKDGQELSF